MKAFAKLDTLEDPEKFPGWIGMIVANTAKNALEKKNPLLFSQIDQENDEGEAMEYQIEDESVLNQPELAYTRQETQMLVRELIDSLSEDQKMCILMFHIEGISIKEIAETMGCSENTVKSRLNYGRKNIKEKAEELQKKGVKLYSSAPVAFLVYLLQREAGAFVLPEIAQTTATFAGFCDNTGFTTASAIGMQGSAGMQVASGMQTASGMQATSGMQVTSSIQVASGMQATSGMQTASGVQGILGTQGAQGMQVSEEVVKTAGKETGKKFLQTVAGKVTVALAAVVGTGIALLFTVFSQPEEVTPATTEVVAEAETEEPATEAPTEEATTEVQLTEEELYYTYLNNVLIPEYGLVETYDSAEFPDAETYYKIVLDENLKKQYEWLEAKGILAADIYDYDHDGSKEMLVVYNDFQVRPVVPEEGEVYVMMINIYGIENEKVVLRTTYDMQFEPEEERYNNDFTVYLDRGTINYDLFVLNRVVVEDTTYLIFSTEIGSPPYSDGWGENCWVMEYREDKLHMCFTF